jgi:hypothetical protein
MSCAIPIDELRRWEEEELEDEKCAAMYSSDHFLDVPWLFGHALDGLTLERIPEWLHEQRRLDELADETEEVNP